MKNLLNRWLLLFVLLLGMSALACNLPFGGEEEPTPRPTQEADDSEAEESVVEETAVPDEPVVTETEQEPVATEEPAVEPTTETAEAEGGLLSNIFPQSLTVRDTVQEFDTLDSYEMEMTITTTVSDTTQTIHATMIVSTDPAQSQMSFSFEGMEDMGGMDSMSMTQIEGISYMIIPEFGCITSSASEAEDTFANSLDANQFLEEVGDATLVGEETINGIETVHYTFDETAMQDETTQFNSAQGDVYVAKEGNYIVRFRLEGEGPVGSMGMAMLEDGADEDQTVGLIVIQMDLVSVNEPVEITIPVECENSGVTNSEYPILEDAYESGSFGGIVTYKTDTPFADAVTFYQESLSAAGWVYQESDSFIMDGTTALMYFDQNDRSLTVTITQETGSSAFTIVIFEE
ncbi:MAG: hypothetical protein H6657_16095 [Ardenticatenaceae bacterium]|nr:hypothetical protein [Ardenticatenaceae bacterium]